MDTAESANPVPKHLPPGLIRLAELSQNLWWSWKLEARQLFELIDPTLWYFTHHNPVRLLMEVKPERLQQLAHDPTFIRHYSAVIRTFDEYLLGKGTWFGKNLWPATRAPPSRIFRLSSACTFPSRFTAAASAFSPATTARKPAIWVCRSSASASCIRRAISISGSRRKDGRKRPTPRSTAEESPIRPALTPAGAPCKISVVMGDRTVAAQVWKVDVGRVALYLLDTNVPENTPENRALSARLYGGDQEIRLCQEILLGIGGVRMLRELGITPTVFHANEGHSAFLTLERIREFVQKGSTHAEASELVRESTVFTTHTPVPAGHDVFPHHLMDRYFAGYWEQLGLSRDEFLRWGKPRNRAGRGSI